MSDVLTIWWVTTGEAGFRTQARGLAKAVAPDATEKVIGLSAPWSLAPPALWPLTLRGLDPAKDRLDPPWPDLIISCGRRAAKAAIAVKRASRGRTLAVHIQNPLAPLGEFDLVIAMVHDGIDGPNVLRIDTALHDVTPAALTQAAELWRPRLARLKRPLTGVLLGGATRRRPFSAAQAAVLIQRIEAARSGGGLVITPSRRTPGPVKAAFAAAYAADPDVLFWDGTGDNPYLGILALSDRIIATGDSVSMVSEAIASGHPVAVFEVDGGARHALFIDNLASRGLIVRLGQAAFALTSASGEATDATPLAAAAVRRLIQTRTGWSG